MTDHHVIEFSGVNFGYNRNLVLENISFHIRQGESLCLVGPNAGGKTTIFKLILGLLKPLSGQITVLGRPPRQARTLIGYMPQHFDFDPKFPVTALDVVLMGKLNTIHGGRFRRADKQAALHTLDKVGLSAAANRPYARLSGGQRQRILIARALVSNPQILLLDEPTANVDLTVEAQFLDSIEKLKEQMTILTITHDLGVVNHFGDRVLCVNRNVHSHLVSELTGDVIREIFSDELRLAHERHTLHRHGDHSHCEHE